MPLVHTNRTHNPLSQFFFQACVGEGGLNSDDCGFQFASHTSFWVPLAIFVFIGLVFSPFIRYPVEEHKRLRILDEQYEQELAKRRKMEKLVPVVLILAIALLSWLTLGGDDNYGDDDYDDDDDGRFPFHDDALQ